MAMKKKRIRNSVFILTFLIFLLLMDYPYLSRLYNDRISGSVAKSILKSEEEADCRRRLLKAQAYNRFLAGEGDIGKKQPEWKRGWMSAAGVLCLEEKNLAGWIRIPALDLFLPLYIGTEEEALNQGAGILEGSSLPVGGAGTHTCISAHRGLPDRTLFTNLDLLKDKDRIEVHSLARTLTYEVYDRETVKPSVTKPLSIQIGRDLLTLITCTPYGINSHRLYVHARRCEKEPVSGKEEKTVPFARRLMSLVFWKLWWWIPASAVLLLVMIMIVRHSNRASFP